jgi:hypothetical protein
VRSSAGPAPGRLLTLLQRPGEEVASVGDIGTRLWDSSVALVRLLRRCCEDGGGGDGDGGGGPLSAERIAGSRVCELGAGCGLAGMAFALHGAASVVLTDLAEVRADGPSHHWHHPNRPRASGHGLVI